VTITSRSTHSIISETSLSRQQSLALLRCWGSGGIRECRSKMKKVLRCFSKVVKRFTEANAVRKWVPESGSR